MGCAGMVASLCFVILPEAKGEREERARCACSFACFFRTPAKVIRGGHGTLTYLGQERWDGTGVQHFQCVDTPAGNDGDGLSLKYLFDQWVCEVEGGHITSHVTIEFSLPVRNVSILRDADGHVRSDNTLTDGSPHQASSLKIVGLVAIQLLTFSLAAASKVAQVGCALVQVP